MCGKYCNSQNEAWEENLYVLWIIGVVMPTLCRALQLTGEASHTEKNSNVHPRAEHTEADRGYVNFTHFELCESS